MNIRKFQIEDLAQVLELCREVRKHHQEILGGYFMPQNDKFEQLGFLASLDNNKQIAWIAENQGEILGYLLAEKKFSPYLEEPNVVHISNIGVKKTHQHQGIGKALMDKFYEQCLEENVDEIRLGVFNKNLQAYNFYEKYGFEPFEQRMHIRLKHKN